jgi:hypothetical protein
MSSESLILMLVLAPVITWGLVGVAHRSHLGQRLPHSKEARQTAAREAMMMWGCGYLGFMALTTIDRNYPGAGDGTALTFVMIGFISYLFAGNVQIFNKWVVTDVVAEMLVDIGLLGLLAALGAIVIEGNPGEAIRRTVAVVMIVSFWGSRHVGRILDSTTRYGEAAREHPGSGQGKTSLQRG